ncbi:Ig-like domain-containing protein [Paenibacillus swuensis]|uniref:Ig-like domain-containing protein n=1 Tax=Paenibacillus swuensis TaxID=1178515 RepID=UPI000837C01C|nr:Ig-like domain-containing protein [Paenibacillus swuensis]
MPYITRFNTTRNGAVTFTGNTMGLSKELSTNNQGLRDSIGAFITLNSSLRATNFPAGTTLDYRLNESLAFLRMPTLSTVLYAELIWGASYAFGNVTVLDRINDSIRFTTPSGIFTVAPDPATAFNLAPLRTYYTRSANVTSLVQQGGPGAYRCGSIPGIVAPLNNSENNCGWTLAVIYANPTLPSRNMTIFAGAELVNAVAGNIATVSGFLTPVTGAVTGRLMVSAQEGDAGITGDQMRFGPNANGLQPIAGPNNPISNFFCSQINGDNGLLDTSGTFGHLNHPPGTNEIGKRQGWDITNVDVSALLRNSQTSASLQGTSTGDVYVINGLGLQVDVNAPLFTATKTASAAMVLVGESITYTVTARNVGTASADFVLLSDSLPDNSNFVPNSLSINGVNQPGVTPESGVSLGTIAPGGSATVRYSVSVVSRPAGSNLANIAFINYSYQSFPGSPVTPGNGASNGVNTQVGNRPPVTQNYTFETPENLSASGQVTGSDPDFDPIEFSLNTPPSNGAATVNLDGTFTYAPNPFFVGMDSFTVLVDDGQGGTAISTITIVVTNQPPVTSDLEFQTPLNQSLSGQVTATDPNGDALTFRLNSSPTSGTVIVNPDGTFNYTPNAGFLGTDSFTVAVVDQNGAAVISTVRITVYNQSPTAESVTISTPENIAISGQITAVDPDGDPLTFTLNSSPINGTVIVTPTGGFTYTPALGFVGTDTFTALVTDSNGASVISTVTINVFDLPPVAQDLTITTPENFPISGTVTASDPNGDPLVFSLSSNPTNGTVLFNADGTFTYTPATGFVGSDSFTFLVADPFGQNDSATVIISVFDLPPIAQDYSVSTPENLPVSGKVVATDPNGDPLTYALNSAPTSGTVVVNPDGTFTYTPAIGFVGIVSFTYIVADPTGETDIGTVTVDVFDQPPAAQDMDLSTPENIPVSGTVTASDPNGDPLTFTLFSGPSNGVAVVNLNGTFTYTPNAGFIGTDIINVIVSDPFGLSDIATIRITVFDQPPVAQDVALSTPENFPVSGTVNATDPDGDPLTFVLYTAPLNGTAVVNPDGTFTYTPALGFVGSDAFNVLVSDPAGLSDIGTVRIEVINNPPVAQDLTLTTPQSIAVSGQVTASDPNGDPLTYTLNAAPENGIAVMNANGTFTYTPNTGFVGTDAFTYKVSDPAGASAIATVRIDVFNMPPITQNINLSTPENFPVNGQVTATDPNGDPLTFALNSVPVNGVAVVNPDGTFTYTPNTGFVGVDTFTVVVSDPFGASASSDITVTVYNLPPVTQNVFINAQENTPVNGQVPATDPNGDAIVFTLNTAPANGVAVVNPDGTFTYTSNVGFVGSDVFTVLVTDTNGGTAVSTVTVYVVTQPPIVQDLTVNTTTNVPVNGQVIATDPDGNPITFALGAAPANGTVIVNPDGSFTYTPNLGFLGTDTFTVVVSDNNGASTTGTVTVNVSNIPPVAQDTSASTPRNVAVSGPVPATDPDGNPLTYAVTVPAANGTAVANPDGTFTYTPNLNFIGTDTFTVTISDGLGGTATSVVTVTVFNQPPITNNLNISTPENIVTSGQVTAFDPDGDSLTFTLNSAATNGAAVVAADGTFTYTPNIGFVGTDTFTLLVNDGFGGVVASMVTITVFDLPPSTQNLALSTPENFAVNGQISASDPNGDPLSITLNAPPTNGTAVVAADGNFTYTPNLNFIGIDSFTIIVSDPFGLSAIATVTVTVYDLPPTVSDLALRTPENIAVSSQVNATDPNGDPLTFTLGASPVNGTAVVNPDGSLIYTPNTGFIGTDAFTVVVSDPAGATAIATVVVTVFDQPPTALNANYSTPENIPFAGQVAASDPDGDPLTYTLTNAPVNGVVALAADGSFTYTANLNFVGTDAFSVTVSDPAGLSANSTITVLVYDQPPTAQNLSLSTPENTPISGQVTATDPDGDLLTFALNSLAVNGTAVVNPDGTFSYFPNLEFAGTDSFTVIVTDPFGESSVATVTISVFDQAPVAQAISLSTPENTAVTGVVSATDPDGDPLTYTVNSFPANGTVILNTADGSFIYTPNPSFVGSNAFTVLVTDPNGLSAIATVNINVFDLPPVAQDLTLNTPASTPIQGQVSATDPNGDPLVFTLNSQALNGTAVLNPNGQFTYTPNPLFSGVDGFTIIVTDPSGLSAVSTVTINVFDQAPTIMAYSFITFQNTPVNGQVIAIDPNGDPITYTVNSEPLNGTVTVAPDGTFFYTPAPGFSGLDSFTVLASTPTGGTAVSTVQVSVINRLPVAQNLEITTSGTTPVNGQVVGSDPDGGALVFSLNAPPTDGTAAVNPDGTFSYTPRFGFVGVDSFTVLVTDSAGASSVSTVTVTVFNIPPLAENSLISTPANIRMLGQVTASDPNGNVLTYAIQDFPQGGTVLLNADGSFIYTPDIGFVGTDVFSVLVNDVNGATALSTITVNVYNLIPTADGAAVVVYFDTPIISKVTGTDPNGDPLLYTVIRNPLNGTVEVDIENGGFRYVPNPGFVGRDSFIFQVNDGYGGVSQSEVAINVSPLVPNLGPDGNNITLTTPQGQPVSGRAQATDPENDAITYALQHSPINGQVVVNSNGTFTYTPDPNFVGAERFTILASEGNGGSVVITVTINVIGGPVNPSGNRAPQINNLSLVTQENTPVRGKLSASDPDGDPLTFSLTQGPRLGFVQLNADGTFVYIPNAFTTGTDTFTVTVSDGRGGTATATVTITIEPDGEE